MNWLTPITLQGHHATLVPLVREHCSELIEAAKDGDLWNLWYASVPAPENMANEIQRRLDLLEKGQMLPFTVIDNKTEHPIGMTSYCNFVENHKRVEIGWTWYRKSSQRTIINTECKFLLLQYAFETLQCNVVRFSANFFNYASRKAIERLGAKFEGILRNHRILRNGVISDDCSYSIINSEWLAVKTNLLSKLQYKYISKKINNSVYNP